MKIAFVEPYFAGSHKQWAEGWAERSAHEVRLFTLPGRYWKWRMHGGAVTLARMLRESCFAPELIVASDMLDLTSFVSLLPAPLRAVPTALYFHENQITYPWNPDDRDLHSGGDQHYAFINFVSSLASSANYFNSAFHMDSYLQALSGFLRQFRDYRELDAVSQIEAKSSVLPLGFDFARMDSLRHEGEALRARHDRGSPIILWNHRWEYDKNPHTFFAALNRCRERGLAFSLVVLGEEPPESDQDFDSWKQQFQSQILHWGYAEDLDQYYRWLWAADIIPVTSIQEFFGVSVVEAVYCNTMPVLPRRLSYPELFSDPLYQDCFYDTDLEFEELLAQRLKSFVRSESELSRAPLAEFNWDRLIGRYDRAFSELASSALIE